jgi:hypothetical protein
MAKGIGVLGKPTGLNVLNVIFRLLEDVVDCPLDENMSYRRRSER